MPKGINSKREIRNSKQIQMTETQNSKLDSQSTFLKFGHLDFEFVLDFDIRISDLRPVFGRFRG